MRLARPSRQQVSAQPSRRSIGNVPHFVVAVLASLSRRREVVEYRRSILRAVCMLVVAVDGGKPQSVEDSVLTVDCRWCVYVAARR